MKAYWSNLTDRERWTLGIGGGCCLVYLFYLLVYSPLITAQSEQAKQLIEKKDTLMWMQQMRQQLQSNPRQQVVTNSQLLTILANQLKTTRFKSFPYQLEQTGAGEIQLSFEQVPFNAFITWLQSIHSTYVMSVKQLDAKRTSITGVVKLVVILVAKP